MAITHVTVKAPGQRLFAGPDWNAAHANDNLYPSINITGAAGNTLIVDTDVLVVDATNDMVGIGITNPDAKLHLRSIGAGDVFRISSYDNDDVTTIIEVIDENVNVDFSLIGKGDDGATGATAYFRGSMGIGTAAPAVSALLDLTSTTGALLVPRMTTGQKAALTAINGMIVYDSTLNKFQGYENGAWVSFI